MIKIADKTIQLLAVDGTISNFDSDWLHSRIVQAFQDSGVQDIWLAEDIALAVEYALQQSFRPDNVFLASELSSAVVKALEDSGFNAAAENYRSLNGCMELFLSPETKTISGLIEQQLGVSASTSQALTARVISAANKLGVNTATPSLYVELAKYYRNNDVRNYSTPAPAAILNNNNNPWLISCNEILHEITSETLQLVENNIISVAGISRLFPSLKLTLRLSRLVDYCKLESPLTEMVMAKHWQLPALAINDIAAVVDKILKQRQVDRHLPVFINIPDMSIFAGINLQASWPEAAGDCREMMVQLEKLLLSPPFKIQMS
jgi:hypothetical protein